MYVSLPTGRTGTAALSVFDCLLVKTDKRLVSLIGLLDLSAAFDTLDHSILTERLKLTFGVTAFVLDWFEYYVHYRSQSANGDCFMSAPILFVYGVPQCSILGPVFFTL